MKESSPTSTNNNNNNKFFISVACSMCFFTIQLIVALDEIPVWA